MSDHQRSDHQRSDHQRSDHQANVHATVAEVQGLLDTAGWDVSSR
jgi:hypothetical protein